MGKYLQYAFLPLILYSSLSDKDAAVAFVKSLGTDTLHMPLAKSSVAVPAETPRGSARAQHTTASIRDDEIDEDGNPVDLGFLVSPDGRVRCSLGGHCLVRES